MTVRTATLADVAGLAALEAGSFPDDAWTEDYLRLAVSGELPTVAVLAAEADGEVVGHVIVSTVFEIAELQRIAVAPEHRRRGVATALLHATAARAAAAGAERLLLEVREHNRPALAFYRKEGFAEIDRRDRYYRDGTTAVILQLDLGAPSAQAQGR
ncbi:ribosomal protein S18-alanine N-acetyltransferase [Nocardioides sp. KR10-350]|uniref:ribosomal protein S18-alanine N-acetyltransferase n=1 Tax=Nocardioides cheoyonin TaxID=3156615 RepID=UPI0032B4F183